MKSIPRAQALTYQLDRRLEPILHVSASEPFRVETEDASSGLMASNPRLPTLENLPYLRHNPVKADPVAGPIFVEGVSAGGRIEVEVVSIEVAGQGTTWNRPQASPLGNSRKWSCAAEPFVVPVTHQNGEAVISERLRWRLAPMIGTLACAPEWEAPAVINAQGSWGGNIDVKDIRAGARVQLNTFHDGGLLFVGDVHGCQGDGEYSAIADETRSEVVLRASPADGAPIPFPRILTEDAAIALGIGRPLEDACHAAIDHLMEWLVDELDFAERDAYLAISLHPDFRLRVYQMTAIRELRYVVGASLPSAFVGLSQ